jgi:hypothetical protein
MQKTLSQLSQVLDPGLDLLEIWIFSGAKPFKQNHFCGQQLSTSPSQPIKSGVSIAIRT